MSICPFDVRIWLRSTDTKNSQANTPNQTTFSRIVRIHDKVLSSVELKEYQYPGHMPLKLLFLINSKSRSCAIIHALHATGGDKCSNKLNIPFPAIYKKPNRMTGKMEKAPNSKNTIAFLWRRIWIERAADSKWQNEWVKWCEAGHIEK